MKGYALARLDKAAPHPDIAEYLERIQGVLDQFGGRFLIHGGSIDVREGQWSGDLILIEFPSMKHAQAFYDSPAYAEIKHLRANHLTGDLILVQGVEPDHDSAAMGAHMRQAALQTS